MKTVLPLKNQIQHYPWGSKQAIPDLLGEENPEDLPWAELWMGAHPKAPSTAISDEGGIPLNVLVARDPDFFLGPEVGHTFGDRLPFLFKVLAAEAPLSIQAHPNLEQARRGYADEEKRGIPINAPERNYRDENHKPELICALTPFTAMCGFRNPGVIAAYLEPVKAAAPLTADGADCRTIFKRMMFLTGRQKKRIIDEVLFHARSRKAAPDRWVIRLSEFYPEDIGIIAPYILNLIELAPGEALALRAGILHSYLHGTGIELMANSDNVLRGGLTGKHVDRDELLNILDFSPADPPLIPAGEGPVSSYSAGVTEFALSHYHADTRQLFQMPETDGPEILLCTEGVWELRAGEESVGVTRGSSVFLAAAAGAYTLQGSGSLFRASVPLSD